MFWFLMGILLVLLARNHFDMQGVGKDLRKIAREIRKIVRDLARAFQSRVKDAKKEPRKAGPEQEAPTAEAHAEQIMQAEAEQECGPAEDPEQTARTAAMLAQVPILAFPEDDPKYDSSRKYGYA